MKLQAAWRHRGRSDLDLSGFYFCLWMLHRQLPERGHLSNAS